MKNSVLIIILSIILFYSCKKKHETPVNEPEEVKDEIVHKDFGTGISLYTVRSFTSYYTVCDNIIPSPSDSTCRYDLDVNGDNIPDFRFAAFHSPYTGNEYCGHCISYNYQINISGLSPIDSIALPLNQPGTRIFSNGTKIEPNSFWMNYSSLRFQSCNINWDFSDGYIGFKIGKSVGYIHMNRLPGNGIKFLDVGFNKTENRPIVCGQK